LSGPDPAALRTQVLVIGSGAGGAVTAATLADAGKDVLVVEEGPDADTASLTGHSTEEIGRAHV